MDRVPQSRERGERCAPVGHLEIELPNGERLTISFSAGIAVAPEDGTNAQQLTQVADTRLLLAKRTGRNRIVCAERTLVAV